MDNIQINLQITEAEDKLCWFKQDDETRQKTDQVKAYEKPDFAEPKLLIETTWNIDVKDQWKQIDTIAWEKLNE